MSNRSGLLEEESAVFAAEKPGAGAGHSSPSQTMAMDTKPQAMDKFLENTLLNVKLEAPLTKRETEILGLIVAGKTNKKIAQKLCRTERTVEYHRHRLMRKLGVKTAAELVKCAIVMGLV